MGDYFNAITDEQAELIRLSRLFFVATADPTSRSGITSYADSSSGDGYRIMGFGKTATLTLILSAGN